MGSSKAIAKLEQEIAELVDLTRDQLVARWIELHGTAPPKTLTPDLLVRGVAYEIQVRELGGLDAVEKKALIKKGARPEGRISKTLKTGTRLYRVWRGVTQEVLVSDGSYSWRGNSYASLSEVARAITGTRWSGPRFFGVTS